MAANNILAGIRKDLDSFVGERIKVKANKGRKRTVEREGILEKTYPNIFVVMINETENSPRRVSFSYTDLLTETVEVVICRENAEMKIACSHK